MVPIVFLLAATAVGFGWFSAGDRSVLFGKPSSMNYGDANRTYRVYQPPNITVDTPVIVGLHGYGGSSQRFAYYAALHNVAADAIVIYPDALDLGDGTKPGWNAKFCCGSGWVTDTDDVGFIATLVEDVRQRLGASDAKVFATGFSNGAFMTHRLAAERPDLFDAVAVSSGSIGSTESTVEPTKPMPILLMHGKLDATIPYAGGAGSGDPNFKWLDFDETCRTWQNINNGTADTKIITYDRNKHQWDGWRLFKIWRRKPSASVEVVSFFRNI